MFQDLVGDNKSHQFQIEINKLLKKNKELYRKNLSYYIPQIIEKEGYVDFFGSNLNWLISYDHDDLLYINKFLNFYFDSSNSNIKNHNDHLCHLIHDLSVEDSFFTNISFQHLVEHSYYYQYLISQKFENSKIFISSSAAFYETNDKKFQFTHSSLTNAYVLVIRNPYELYKKYLQQEKGNKNNAMHRLLNYEKSINQLQFRIDGNQERFVEENSQNWQIHTQSWTDPNVQSTFNGLVVRYDQIIQDTQDALRDILRHFMHNHLEFSLDYQIIRDFVKQNPIQNNVSIDDISNQDKKIIQREFKSLLTKFRFD